MTPTVQRSLFLILCGGLAAFAVIDQLRRRDAQAREDLALVEAQAARDHEAMERTRAAASKQTSDDLDRLLKQGDRMARASARSRAAAEALLGEDSALDQDVRAQELLDRAQEAARRRAPRAEVQRQLEEVIKAAGSELLLDAASLAYLELLARRACYPELLSQLRGGFTSGVLGRLDPDRLTLLEAVGAAGARRPDEARQAWTRLAETGAGALQVCAQGELALLSGDAARAASLAEQARQEDPGLLQARELWARAVMNERPQEVLTEYLALVEAEPDHLDWRIAAWSLAFVQGRWDVALEHLTATIELGEERVQPRILGFRGQVLWQLERYEEALADFERLVQADPGGLDAQVWRALCWRGAGQEERARAALRQLAAERPEELQAWREQARKRGGQGRALAWLDEASAAAGD